MKRLFKLLIFIIGIGKKTILNVNFELEKLHVHDELNNDSYWTRIVMSFLPKKKDKIIFVYLLSIVL